MIGRYGQRQAEHEGVPVGLVGIARQAQEADAAHERSKNGHRHHPYREVVIAQRKGRGRFILGIKRSPKQGNATHVDQEYGQVEEFQGENNDRMSE